MIRASLFVAGSKGANFLKELLEGPDAPAPDPVPGVMIDPVVSYATSGLRHDPRAEIEAVRLRRGLRYRDRGELRPEDHAACDLVLVAGWQYLLAEIDARFIVFHDSLLPRLRGFNPTVTALILGETRLGVTAFRPEEGVDAGPIYGQEAVAVEEGIAIGEACRLLGGAYARLARRVLDQAAAGVLAATPQDHAAATHSLWRNEDDYAIDWNAQARVIRRFINAVGWPYQGARTRYRDQDIRIDAAVEIDDLAFPLRQPGKIWALVPGDDPAAGAVGSITVAGWATLILSIWFVGGIIIFFLGVYGLYIGHILRESKRHPTYIIDRVVVRTVSRAPTLELLAAVGTDSRLEVTLPGTGAEG